MKDLIRHILREHTREIGEIKKTTTPEFIEKAKVIHGNKYDYSKVDYKGNAKNVEIICKIHGPFIKSPANHLKGQGCPICALKERNKKLSSNTEDFIERAKELHGEKYDYSKVNYKNSTTKVEIICPKHGPFLQVHSSHLAGNGCDKCAREVQSERQKLSQDEFINKLEKIHGEKYGFDKSIYTGRKGSTIITCPTHGDVEVKINGLLEGEGCPLCAGRRRTNDDIIQMIRKIHGDRYDYSKVNFKNNKIPITLICPKHGEFKLRPESIIYQSAGCPKCSGRNLSNDEWIDRAKQIHGSKYDYSKFNYINAITKTTVICPKHGEFQISPNDHINNENGCAYCNESKGEKLIDGLLTKHEVKSIRQYKFLDCTNEIKGSGCRKLPFDFYLPEMNIAIEYDGQQHYVPVWGEEGFKNIQRTDKLKNQYCKKNGIKLIRIPYTMKKEEIEPYILKELGIK